MIDPDLSRGYWRILVTDNTGSRLRQSANTPTISLAFHLGPLLRRLALSPGQKVLDVGSGQGFATMELAARVSAFGRVAGVDCRAAHLAAELGFGHNTTSPAYLG